ncbi:MAG TPA: hypothetical protein PLS65_09700 [Ferruginibacter sp.]|jgi:hypothetical protein|nr:hypothetical protein [Chitinophagales bacterium]HNJ95037.1 hypothetical protein [Ferruginibacter sp.]
MKKQATTPFASLNNKQLEALSTQVKETIAYEKARIFSAVDLWNIQRRGRTMVSRRNFAF